MYSGKQKNSGKLLPPKSVIDYYETVHTLLWEYPHLSIKPVTPVINMQPKQQEQELHHFNQQNEKQTISQVNTVSMAKELVKQDTSPRFATSNMQHNSNNGIYNKSVKYEFLKNDTSLNSFLDELDSLFLDPNSDIENNFNQKNEENIDRRSILNMQLPSIDVQDSITGVNNFYNDEIYKMDTSSPSQIVLSNNLDQNEHENIDLNTILNKQHPSIHLQNNITGVNNFYNDSIYKMDTNSPTQIVVSNNLDQNNLENIDPNPTLNMQLYDESTKIINTPNSEPKICKFDTIKKIVVPNIVNPNLNMQLATQIINSPNSGNENYKVDTPNVWIESNLATEIVEPNNVDPTLNMQLPFAESTQNIYIPKSNTENYQIDTINQINQELNNPMPNVNMQLPFAEPSQNIKIGIISNPEYYAVSTLLSIEEIATINAWSEWNWPKY